MKGGAARKVERLLRELGPHGGDSGEGGFGSGLSQTSPLRAGRPQRGALDVSSGSPGPAVATPPPRSRSQTPSTSSPELDEDVLSMISGFSPSVAASLSDDDAGKRYLLPKRGKVVDRDVVELEIRKRTAYLEEQITALTSSKLELEVKHAAERERLHGELGRVQRAAAQDLKELLTRQEAVEKEAPLLKNAMASAKDALKTLGISQEQYDEIRQIEPAKRSLREEVVFRMHEFTVGSKAEMEALRIERDTSRETAARATEEAMRMAREQQRLTISLRATEEELQRDLQIARTRCERLEAELEEALLTLEVNSAKAAMYDDVKAKLEAAEAKTFNALDTATSDVADVKFLRADRKNLQQQMKDIQHKNELLLMDKAYLQKEVHALEDRLSKLETEHERVALKYKEVKRARTELQERLLKTTESSALSYETRLQSEISRLHDQHASDVDKVRAEVSHMADQELRLLRERRDVAERDLNKISAELKEERQNHAALQELHRAAVQSADRSQAAAYGELQARAFEQDRLTVLLEEKQAALKAAQLELECVAKKLRVTTDNYYALETQASRKTAELEASLASQAARLNHYEILEQDIDSAILQIGDGTAEGSGVHETQLMRTMGSAMPTAVQRRVQQSLTLARKCTRLQRELETAVAEKAEAREELAGCTRALEAAEAKLQHTQQPYSYLVEVLHSAEQRLQESKSQVSELEMDLAESQRQLGSVVADREALREDVRGLLSERKVLSEMRQTLTQALHEAQQQRSSSVTGCKGQARTGLTLVGGKA